MFVNIWVDKFIERRPSVRFHFIDFVSTPAKLSSLVFFFCWINVLTYTLCSNWPFWQHFYAMIRFSLVQNKDYKMLKCKTFHCAMNWPAVLYKTFSSHELIQICMHCTPSIQYPWNEMPKTGKTIFGVCLLSKAPISCEILFKQ